MRTDAGQPPLDNENPLLLGTNELAIASTVTSVWNAVTSPFSSDYTSYDDTGGYSDYGFDRLTRYR